MIHLIVNYIKWVMNIKEKQLIICEEVSSFRNKFVRQIEDVISENEFDISVKLVTGDTKEVINYLEKSQKNCIYIIDAEFTVDVSGFQVAKYVRLYDAFAYIVLITKKDIDVRKVFKNKIEVIDYIKIDSDVDYIERIENTLEYVNKKQVRHL